jgi:CcmD family protein
MELGGLGWILIVNLVIWTGLFLYLLRLGKRLKEREMEREP